MAAPRPAPAQPRAAAPGFDLDRENSASARHYAPSHQPGTVVRRPADNGRVSRGGTIVNYPGNRNRSAWGWNRGIAWEPSPAYWGGGFWGPFGFGVSAGVIGADAYGSYEDAETNQDLSSYQVATGSPGADLLLNYHLTQTPCGPPNLVVILGPDQSVICAYPNDLVSAGQYTLDASQLTLTSQ